MRMIRSHTGKRESLPEQARQSQTALPPSINKTWGEPSSSIGHSVGLPPIGGSKKKTGPMKQAAIVSPEQFRFISVSMTANTRVKTLTGKNTSRRYMAIQNNGAVTIFVGFGTVPKLTGDNALRLPANTGITFDGQCCPNNDVFVVASTDCQVTVVEGMAI